MVRRAHPVAGDGDGDGSARVAGAPHRPGGLRGLLTRPLPVPPAAVRVGPLREGAFRSRLRSERVASYLGVSLGVTFSVCFLTGLVSHFMQNPPAGFTWPTRPVNLYRVTQGLHVLTGLAAIPLLLAKLWTVYPKLWEWPPARNVAHAVERLALLALVGGAVFQLFTGLINIAYWYPFRFLFTSAHYWTAWVVIGAMVIHIGTKAAVARRGLSGAPDPVPPVAAGLSRRGFLGATFAASAVLVAASAGATVPFLRRLTLLAPRRGDIGPQGLPVNKSAVAAGVTDRARDPAYRLRVTGKVSRPLTLTVDELGALPQTTVSLPITCVEGWSAGATWSGVRVRDLLDRAGADEGASVRLESLEGGGLYRSSVLDSARAHDPLTLLALGLGGQPLALDHGYPCRLIAPNRPGVMQTKWVTEVVVL